jgi:hypothetical protein
MLNIFIGVDEMEIIKEVVSESIVLLPMLFVMYFLLEYYEIHDSKIFNKLRKNGPFYGALLGVIPQCGISVIASLLFLEKEISIGTLIAVYIATSDEAIPLLLTNPSLYNTTIIVILVKFLLAIVFGYLIDYFVKTNFKKKQIQKQEESHSLWQCVISRTLKIYLFIVVIHLILSYLFEYIGEEQLSIVLLNQSLFQPIIASLFGLIPHCIVSVVLTQLYSNQILSFASLISGLMTNAGMGLIVLVKYRVKRKTFIQVIFLLLISAIISGLIIQSIIYFM